MKVTKKEFPSPLGDEVLKPLKDGSVLFSQSDGFPSPLGDEVLKPINHEGLKGITEGERFRPLSGMRYLNQLHQLIIL